MLPALCLLASGDTPKLPGIGAAIQSAVDAHEIAGAVTVVVTRDGVVHCEATGLADLARQDPVRPDSMFWIASMTKPLTAAAILMLQDEGKLNVADPVAKHLPAFAELKTPSGRPANLTIAQLLTHTSGLNEGEPKAVAQARTLAELVPLFVAARMQFGPGTQWRYCQSGINTAGRIMEVVSGQTFDGFLQSRLFDPLGMTNTTFYPARKPAAQRAVAYRSNRTTGALDGKRYLSPAAMTLLTTVQTGELPTGFLQSAEWGNRGTNYGWGIGTCILRAPHPGVAAMLSPGTFGHGGAWGTQAWMDPVRGIGYVLMVQRADFGNSDGSELRRRFQERAVAALGR